MVSSPVAASSVLWRFFSGFGGSRTEWSSLGKNKKMSATTRNSKLKRKKNREQNNFVKISKEHYVYKAKTVTIKNKT